MAVCLVFFSPEQLIMAHLNIIFENLSKFFFEEEKIKAKLELNLNKTCTANNIVANFVGLSSYLNKDGKQNNMSSKFFSKNQTHIYFDDAISLFAPPGKEPVVWSPGIQVFSFEYQLPYSLPSSLEFSQGYVRYSLHITVEIDGETIKKTEHFTVVSKTDLNENINARLPIVLWKPENQCCIQDIFWRSGSTRAFFHIAKRGYVPGEYLFINAEISNFHSRYPIEWVKATFIQILKHNNSKAVLEKRIIAEIVRGCILPNETQTWLSESIVIPAIPPSSNKFVKVKYNILFQYKPSWQRKPSEFKHKLLIGVVRLLEFAQEEQGGGEKAYSSEFFDNSNLEPCVFGPHYIEEDGKSSTFSPLYPMYVVM